MGMNSITVIFANKNQWNIFQGGKIQALVKDTFVGAAITKKADNHVIFLLDF